MRLIDADALWEELGVLYQHAKLSIESIKKGQSVSALRIQKQLIANIMSYH